MHTNNRHRRVYIRNALFLAAVTAVAILLGVPAKAHDMSPASSSEAQVGARMV